LEVIVVDKLLLSESLWLHRLPLPGAKRKEKAHMGQKAFLTP